MSSSGPDAYGAVTAPDTVRFERLLPGPVERVWAYLTEPDKRRQWFAGGEMELKPGGAVNLLFRHSEFTDEPAPEKYADMNAKGFPSQHRIVDIDPPRMLAMTWPGEDGRESEVVFELFPEGDKVLLVLTHTRLVDRGDMANFSSGWHAHLGVLATVLEGGRVKRFWSRIPELEADYQKRFVKG